MKKNTLSVKHICDLIRTCGECGVQQLRFGELHVAFTPTKTEHTALGETPPEQSAVVEEAISLRDQIQDQEDLIQELNLSDPAEFERQLSLGELENERSRTEPAIQ